MAVRDDLKDTQALCLDLLNQAEAHPIYTARLKLAWTIVAWAVDQNPAHWQAALDRAERIVDIEQAKR